MTDWLALDLTEVAAALADGQITARALMAEALAAAGRAAPLNAIIALDADAALADAAAADAERAQGRLRGPLHGVPVAHKDMFDRAGRQASYGSRIGQATPAAADATAVARLTGAGAIQFATLGMAEFAFGPTGHNQHFGAVRNPWALDRITGGSSSGAAAAVAARLCFAALGSDTGGSIRGPAHFCGVSGLKPTYGLISRAGAMPLSPSLDTIGPLARSVADLALLTGLLAGTDPADPTSSPRPVPDYQAALGHGLRGLRIGRPDGYFDAGLDPEVAAAVAATAAVLADLGATLVPVPMPDLEPLNAFGVLITAAEAAAHHGPWMRLRPQDYSEQVRNRLLPGYGIAATDYIDALRARAGAIAAFAQAVLDRVDLLLCPVAPVPALPIADTDVGGSPAMQALLGRLTGLTRPFNYLGLPALAIPAGLTDAGLPVGVQLIGRPFDEATLFAAGHAFQSATDWHRRRPPA